MKEFLLSFLVFLFLGCSAQQQSTKEKIDQVFQHVNEQTPGYMLGVMHESDFIFQKGYGLANLEHNIPIDSSSAFNVASLSKQFTAAAIALLILDDKISLDDEVAKHLPDFPFKASKMQIKHLIYMTSGINDYYYNPRRHGVDWSSLQFFSIDTAIHASYASQELMYAPGTQWSYSNINYMLLTKIVEKVSDLPFSTFVQQRIFKPLGMHNSFVNDDIFQVIPNRASNYNYRDKENTDWLKESGYLKTDKEGFLQINRNSPHYGGSGIYTSMNDMKKWIANFHSHQLGSDAFYDLMHLTMKFEHDKSNDAFGLIHGDYKGHEMVWYEGGDWGCSAYMVRFPESGYTVVCFSNLGTGNARKYVYEVLEVLIGDGVIRL